MFFHLLIFSFFGAVLGSFSSAIIYRIENKQSWITSGDHKPARSACPYCQHPLKVKDLIPLISWLMLKGQCRYCQAKISIQYVGLEIVSIVGAVGIYMIFGFSLYAFLVLALQPFILSQILLIYRRNIISRQLCVIIGIGIIAYIALLFM